MVTYRAGARRYEGVAEVSARGRPGGRSAPARSGAGSGSRGRPQGARRADGTPRSRGPRPDAAAQRDRLREVVQPVVTAAGYDLEDLTLSRAGRRHLVRVVVDGDGGVTLDAIADVSRALSAALDAAEEAGGELLYGEYALEVGSPGVDRPLTLPRHWRRNVGRLVAVPVRPARGEDRAGEEPGTPGNGGTERHLTGRVLAADDTGIVLEAADEAHELAYERLGPGRVQIEFTRLAEVSDDDLADDDGLEEQDDEEWEDEER
jgi:ribosome maturation factor RimP